jgi:UDP-glucose 4-epimerase
MKVLLTGGSGFIGRNVVEQLGGRYEILAPTHTELELTDADAVAAWLRRHPVDAVIHAAVRPGHRNAADASRQLEINLRMFTNLTRCPDAWGRMIYLSSGAVYGTQADVVRAREGDVGRRVPNDEHGFSRFVLAQLARQTANCVELRPFGVFGRHEDYAIRFISNAICKTLFSLPVTLRRDRRFSYLRVDDLMPVLEHFLTCEEPAGAYNVVPDHADDLRALATVVVGLSGKDLPVQVAQDGVGLEYTGDNTRLRAEMPDLRFTPTSEAVERLYEWYASRKASIVKERLLVDK